MRQEKQFLLDEIKGQIEERQAFVILSYSGLKANAANEFREGVAQLGGEIEMVPKRVLLKGADELGVSLKREDLPGHIGLVFSGEDALEMTKYVIKYSKESEKAVEVIGGRFDGQLYSAADVEKLSKLPSMDEMRAQFLATLQAPLGHTLSTMQAILASVVYCLDNNAKKLGGNDQ